MADEEILSRFFQLKSQGVPLGEAWERSRIEHALKSWPDHWGDYLHVSLYGAIDISDDIDVPGLGGSVSNFV
jgi:hypothetical protein